MGITAFIPSRYGSTRFPAKPLALIAGQPMIRHVYQCASLCPEISGVYVVTDDDRIKDCVEGFGGKAVMTKKEHQSGTDRIAEAVQILGLKDDDLVVNVQGDQPLFDPSIISRLIFLTASTFPNLLIKLTRRMPATCRPLLYRMDDCFIRRCFSLEFLNMPRAVYSDGCLARKCNVWMMKSSRSCLRSSMLFLFQS